MKELAVIYRQVLNEEVGTMENTNRMQEVSKTYISSNVRFYTIKDLIELLGWSEMTVQKLFNDPKFPSANFGRQKIVEAHALIEYFSKKHIKERERHWM